MIFLRHGWCYKSYCIMDQELTLFLSPTTIISCIIIGAHWRCISGSLGSPSRWIVKWQEEMNIKRQYLYDFIPYLVFMEPTFVGAPGTPKPIIKKIWFRESMGIIFWHQHAKFYIDQAPPPKNKKRTIMTSCWGAVPGAKVFEHCSFLNNVLV